MNTTLAVFTCLFILGGTMVLAGGLFHLSKAWRTRDPRTGWEGLALSTTGAAIILHSPWILAFGIVILAFSIRMSGTPVTGGHPPAQPPPLP
ncbi:hypothetical protein [Streptomyces sp. NPDC051662]|uniref:hypothetical protein n=1 Tax=Streptomyces sp. NPDC051662 TaxID=3154750 RepID=UPI00343629D8